MTDSEELYAMECKYYKDGDCAKQIVKRGANSFMYVCDGDCARMKKYRKLKHQHND